MENPKIRYEDLGCDRSGAHEDVVGGLVMIIKRA
jgi:hypothetical protein